jgi:hypothetical protein
MRRYERLGSVDKSDVFSHDITLRQKRIRPFAKISANDPNLRIVVMVQERSVGRVLGAAIMRFSN